MTRYKCPVCKASIVLRGLKHVKVCDNCHAIINVDDLKKSHVKQDKAQSVLDKILNSKVNIAYLSASAMLSIINK